MVNQMICYSSLTAAAPSAPCLRLWVKRFFQPLPVLRLRLQLRLPLLLLIQLLLTPQCLMAQSRPNVVLVLADDLGWSDLGCYGADLMETPNLDRLAAQSMRFTHAYAPAPVCTPTRASIMTGKHPARLQMTIWSEGSLKGPQDRLLLQAKSLHDLPLAEVTLAEHFQKAGYLTALVGKWHLGDADHAAETQGFDINIGGTHWGAPQTFWWPYRGSGRFGAEFRYVPHLEFGKAGEYLTDRLTDEALRVMQHAVQTQQPFFLYLAHHAPHTPIEAKEEDVRYFESKLKPDLHHQHPVYAAMIRSLDQSVGRIVAKLKELQLDKNTIVIFTSDNGGYIGTSNYADKPQAITNNWPLRSGKGSLYEGGLRVPLIVHWPGLTQPAQTNSQPIVLTDLFPTLLKLIDPQYRTDAQAIDGFDLSQTLRDPSQKLPRQELAFHYPHYYHAPPTTPCGALRVGDWKLIEWFEDGRSELYHLAQDEGEQIDLAAQNADKVTDLRQKLSAWRERVGAAMPTRSSAQR